LEESIASISRVENPLARNQHEQVASRLSHQSKTPSYIGAEGEGEREGEGGCMGPEDGGNMFL
jgi:hypothetical protein